MWLMKGMGRGGEHTPHLIVVRVMHEQQGRMKFFMT